MKKFLAIGTACLLFLTAIGTAESVKPTPTAKPTTTATPKASPSTTPSTTPTPTVKPTTTPTPTQAPTPSPSETPESPEETPPPKRCKTGTGQCIDGGDGLPCWSEHDCGEHRCQANSTNTGASCVLGGDGIVCNPDSPNEMCTKRCHHSGTCKFGGEGKPCSADSECAGKWCSYYGEVEGENVIICAEAQRSMISCTDSAGPGEEPGQGSCPSDPKFCKPDGTCAVHRTGDTWEKGAACDAAADCTYSMCQNGKCRKGGDLVRGRACSPRNGDNDCSGKRCDIITCKDGTGRGYVCGDTKKCSHRACFEAGMPVLPHDPRIFDYATCREVQGVGEDLCKSHEECQRRFPVESPGAKAGKTEPRFASTFERVKEEALLKMKAAHAVGKENAPIRLVVFHDLLCSMCKRAQRETITQVEKEWVTKGLVQILYRDFPLGLRPLEATLAEGARCAGKQGKYVQYVNKIHSDMKDAAKEKMPHYAKLLGLDLKKFKACTQSRQFRSSVRADFEAGAKLGIDGTPTFFINDLKVPGAISYDLMKRFLDDELKRVKPDSVS